MKLKKACSSLGLIAILMGYVYASDNGIELSPSKRAIIQAADGKECVEVTFSFTELEKEVYHLFDDFEMMINAHSQAEFQQFFKLLMKLLEKTCDSSVSRGTISVAVAPCVVSKPSE